MRRIVEKGVAVGRKRASAVCFCLAKWTAGAIPDTRRYAHSLDPQAVVSCTADESNDNNAGVTDGDDNDDCLNKICVSNVNANGDCLWLQCF